MCLDTENRENSLFFGLIIASSLSTKVKQLLRLLGNVDTVADGLGTWQTTLSTFLFWQGLFMLVAAEDTVFSGYW